MSKMCARHERTLSYKSFIPIRGFQCYCAMSINMQSYRAEYIYIVDTSGLCCVDSLRTSSVYVVKTL